MHCLDVHGVFKSLWRCVINTTLFPCNNPFKETIATCSPIDRSDRFIFSVKSMVTTKRKSRTRRWSAHVTKHSNALDLKHGVFKQNDPAKIARSVYSSAKRSRRKKTSAKRSAMSMISFYINRAGRNLPASRKRILQKAKEKLRAMP